MPKDFALDLAVEVELPAGNPYQGVYTIRFQECTGLDDLACREATGLTLLELWAEREKHPSMSAVFVAMVAWLNIRKTRTHVTFEMVAATVTWGGDWDLRDPQADDAGKEPVGSENSQPNTDSPEPSPA